MPNANLRLSTRVYDFGSEVSRISSLGFRASGIIALQDFWIMARRLITSFSAVAAEPKLIARVLFWPASDAPVGLIEPRGRFG